MKQNILELEAKLNIGSTSQHTDQTSQLVNEKMMEKL
jgi:hypothetical protein